MNLYSYSLPFDVGAAPNPYWGICTLTICKPVIRRSAVEGDWIVGLGSTNSPLGDISSSVVYVMRVTSIKSMAAYDTYCRTHVSGKLPDLESKDFRKRVGDCIYDFSAPEHPVLRPSVHDEGNRKTDLSGRNALLSEHFYYFGDKPIPLPSTLLPIVHRAMGHKSSANAPYRDTFLRWIESLELQPGTIHGEPQLRKLMMEVPSCSVTCSRQHQAEDEQDQEHHERREPTC